LNTTNPHTNSNLGAINLEQFVTADRQLNVSDLQYTARLATRMLDNVIDLTDFPVARVSKVFRDNRRVGLGVMGFADMLFKMRIAYNSEAGRIMAETVIQYINDAAHIESRLLASEKCDSFPNLTLSVFKVGGGGSVQICTMAKFYLTG